MEEEGERDDDQEYCKVKETRVREEERKKMKNWKKYLACVFSLMVSMAGGAVLVFWELKHHQTNTQLWMVPVGLILFATPAFIWVSSFFSDLICCNTTGGGGGGRSSSEGGGGGDNV